ncbi:MAG TPA: aminotransferase class I/II-fold pyridoxal phosphate-dependent enzyme, partial [Bacillota bacterium]|nr:aminotransferase class I/II-fold pyridoxal phosphate-dependent enzyme [Bacillota bacterium]
MNREDGAPLFDGLRRYLTRHFTAFHTPGHRGGAGLIELSGSDLLRMDLTELTDLDGQTVQAWRGEAEALASELFGADRSYFLVNGATEGILALSLSIGEPGDEVIVVRDCHLSVFHGMILSGLKPVFISPGWLRDWNLPVLPPVEALQKVLAAHPKAKAVWVTHPSYAGVVGDLRPWADLAHRAGLPLIVDEAHGGYLSLIDSSFHEAREVADAWVHGAHKIMGSMTQTGLLHLHKGRLDEYRVNAALDWVRSTSPSYPLLCSLDLIRRRMSQDGKQAYQRVAEEASILRQRLAAAGISALSVQDGPYRYDPMKLVLTFISQGIGGYEAQERLRGEHRIQAEYADGENIVFFLSPFQSREDLERLFKATQTLVSDSQRPAAGRMAPPAFSSETLAMSPREAAFSPHETVEV